MFFYLSTQDVNITHPSLDIKTAFQIFLRLSLNFSMNNMHGNCFQTKEKNDFMIATARFFFHFITIVLELEDSFFAGNAKIEVIMDPI